jgi:hypothetical protein
MANYSLSGKMLVSSIALHTYVKGEIMNGALDFITLLEVSSCPDEFFIFKDFIIFFISLVVACCCFIFAKGLVKTSAK